MAQPAQQFEAVKTPPKPTTPVDSLEGQLNKLLDKFWSIGRPARARRQFIQAQAELFSKGIHFFSYKASTGQYREWDKEDQDMYCPVPLVQFAVESIAAEYGKVKPKVIPHTEYENEKVKAVAAELENVADSLFSKFYLSNPELRQRESKFAPLRDMVYVFLEHDKSKGQKYQIPDYQGQEKQVCLDCGGQDGVSNGVSVGGNPGVFGGHRQVQAGQTGTGTGEFNTAPQISQTGAVDSPVDAGMGMGTVQPMDGLCPACGSANVQFVMQAVNAGMIEARQGEVVRHVVDPFLVDEFSRGFGIEDTPYLRYDEALFVTEAEELYPYVTIKGQANLGSTETGFNGLHTLRQLETLVSNTGKLDQGKPDYILGLGSIYLEEFRCKRSRVWLRPHTYRKVAIPASSPGYELPGTDDVIPGGAKLIDMFPDGLCVHLINDQIVKLERSCMDKCWSSYRYSVPTSGRYGAGVAALVSLNKAYDELNSIETQWSLMASLGITLVDERIKNFKNKPGTKYPVADRGLMGDEPLANFIAHVSTPGPGPEVAGLRQSYRELISDLSRTQNPDVSGLTPDGMRTATGVRYRNSVMNTMSAPMLELFAANTAKVITQAIQMERENGQRPRFYSDFGKTTGTWLDPLDIPEDICFIVEEDSHQPRTMQDHRDDAMAFVGAGGGQGTLAPEIEENLARVFRQPRGENDYDQWAIKAQKRLDALKQVAETMGDVPPAAEDEMAPPDEVMEGEQSQMLPPSPVDMLISYAQATPQPLDNNAMFGRFWVETYLSDEFDDFPPLLQSAIVQLYQMHEVADAQKMGRTQTLQTLAAAPSAQIQQGIAQSGQPDQAEGENAKAQNQAVLKDQETDAKREDAKESRKHDVKMETLKHKHQLAIEKVKAKSKPKAKK